MSTKKRGSRKSNPKFPGFCFARTSAKTKAAVRDHAKRYQVTESTICRWALEDLEARNWKPAHLRGE